LGLLGSSLRKYQKKEARPARHSILYGTTLKITSSARALTVNWSEPFRDNLASQCLRNSHCETARIAAIRELLDRGYARPRQAVEVSAPAGDPLQELFDEIDALSRKRTYKQVPNAPA
jgi:hypothetical protein